MLAPYSALLLVRLLTARVVGRRCDSTQRTSPFVTRRHRSPLLQRLDVADVIDRHLPPDPQLEFSHGSVLRLLLTARLASPTAFINVSAWAERTIKGAEYGACASG